MVETILPWSVWATALEAPRWALFGAAFTGWLARANEAEASRATMVMLMER